jgi:hypothetical protein
MRSKGNLRLIDREKARRKRPQSRNGVHNDRGRLSLRAAVYQCFAGPSVAGEAL